MTHILPRRRLRRSAGGLTLLVLVGTSALAGAQQAERLPPDPAPLPPGMHCPVDGDEVRTGEHRARWEGREFYMDRQECLDAFVADPEPFARAVEPRAALFRAPNPDRESYGPGFLILGLYVVAGLVAGGIASFVAIQKGLGGGAWFLYGFLLNVVALALVSRQPARPVPFRSDGLTKLPRTHAPRACPACGQENHPSAARCSRCGRALEPTTTSEVARAT